MKKLLIIFAISAFVIASAGAIYRFEGRKNTEIDNIFARPSTKKDETFDAGHASAKNEIDRYAQESIVQENSDDYINLGITSHHLPNALPLILNFYGKIASTHGPRDVFVILAPDHLEKCTTQVSTSPIGYETPYGLLSVDKDLTNEFLEAGVSIDGECFRGDHSIGAQAVMIKKFFPNAEIVPLVFSSATSQETVEVIGDILTKNSSQVFVLGSVDFSHHNDYAKAESIDNQTQNFLENLQSGKLTLENVDSPAAAKILINLANSENLKTNVIDRKNSYIFSGNDKDTTGYMSIVFMR